MFSLFKRKSDEVNDIYINIIEQSRNPILYTDYNVPDKPIGRFQMLTLHAAPFFIDLINKGYSKTSQTLFDKIFSDIELSFREIGVGDLGVPKKMKRYMKDFNGIIHAHAAANADHAEITRRNVFGDEGVMDGNFKLYIEGLFKP